VVIFANKWKQLLVQRQFLLAPVPIKNSILSIAKSPNLQKTLDFPAGSQYSRRGDEWHFSTTISALSSLSIGGDTFGAPGWSRLQLTEEAATADNRKKSTSRITSPSSTPN
jgi:hypothetical protein